VALQKVYEKDAFNAASGTFAVPESGVYLFMLRGKVSPNEDSDRKCHILILSNSEYPGLGLMTRENIIAAHTVRSSTSN